MERRLAAILVADVAGYSRMMAANETATLATLQRHRAEVLAPTIALHHGRVVKLMGDGILAEFPSIVEAVDCAVKVQREMAQRNTGLSDEERVAFRIGVHLGDVMVDGDDLYGDGVNVAARLEAIAEVGGICISAASHDEVEHKLELNFRALGPQMLKNIPRPVVAYAIEIIGARPAMPLTRYCRTPDGVRLAYAVAGTGPNLVMAGRWFTHLEYNWANPHTAGEAFIDLARDFRFLRYNSRGNGLSDWEVSEISLSAWVRDLEVVVDAAGYDQFALLGGSQGAPTAIAYAANHPERVSPSHPHGRLCARMEKTPRLKHRATRGDDEPNAFWLGFARPLLPAVIRVSVHAERYQGGMGGGE